MNLAFGLVGSFPAFMGIWLVNGLAQSTGAPSRIKVLATLRRSPELIPYTLGSSDGLFNLGRPWLSLSTCPLAYAWR